MSDKPVYRLVDIEVEEISLVDRAANKHRFLVVKRSHMSDANEEQESTEEAADSAPEADEDGGADEDETDEQADDDDGDGDDDGAGGASGAAADEPEVAQAAAEALSKLTTIVEGLARGARGATLTKAKEELRAVMDSLAKAAGARKGPKRKPPARPPAEDDEDDEGVDKSAMEEIRAAFQRVQELLARHGKRSRKPNKPNKTSKTTKREAASDDSAVATKLDAVLAQLGALSTANKDQAQRLSRLEKHSGMPNSAPVGEQRTGDDDDANVLWSLDLNKPTEREQVDKATSFY